MDGTDSAVVVGIEQGMTVQQVIDLAVIYHGLSPTEIPPLTLAMRHGRAAINEISELDDEAEVILR